MHGPFVPDAINFTIKYMYMMEGGGGGGGGGVQKLWLVVDAFTSDA